MLLKPSRELSGCEKILLSRHKAGSQVWSTIVLNIWTGVTVLSLGVSVSVTAGHM